MIDIYNYNLTSTGLYAEYNDSISDYNEMFPMELIQNFYIDEGHHTVLIGEREIKQSFERFLDELKGDWKLVEEFIEWRMKQLLDV